MPFKSPAQEYALMINQPSLWKDWVKRYGHAKGWAAYKKSRAKKAAATKKRRKGGGKKKTKR